MGRSPTWIRHDENSKLRAATPAPGGVVRDDLFFLTEDTHGSVSIAFQKTIEIHQASSEEQELTAIDERIRYLRLPVTDHCRPDADVVVRFLQTIADGNEFDWVHFHCHGGDGRTTSFLALYDMVCWRRANPGIPMLSMAEFNARQLKLFTYDLCPADPTSWKYPLALERWICLDEWRERIGLQ